MAIVSGAQRIETCTPSVYFNSATDNEIDKDIETDILKEKKTKGREEGRKEGTERHATHVILRGSGNLPFVLV